MAFITIDGVDLPAPIPGGYKINLGDLDSENSSRSQSGRLHRERIRPNVYKLQITWRVRQETLKKITDAISPASFSCTFFDGTTSGYKTATMYAGDRDSNLMIRKEFDSDNIWELSVSLIEY